MKGPVVAHVRKALDTVKRQPRLDRLVPLRTIHDVFCHRPARHGLHHHLDVVQGRRSPPGLSASYLGHTPQAAHAQHSTDAAIDEEAAPQTVHLRGDGSVQGLLVLSGLHRSAAIGKNPSGYTAHPFADHDAQPEGT